MASSSNEKSFGSRLGNAKKILLHLQSFKDYKAVTNDQSIASLQAFIATIDTINTNTATCAHSYAIAVDNRQGAFTKNPDSVVKLMTPISRTIRSFFGKKSKEATFIRAMVIKIRGVNAKKSTTGAKTKKISQSSRGFDSVLKTFGDVVATLDTYGASYNPSKANITITALKLKLQQLTALISNATVTSGALKQKRNDRAALYETLSIIFQRVKDAVGAQYGITATEFILIKGLAV